MLLTNQCQSAFSKKKKSYKLNHLSDCPYINKYVKNNIINRKTGIRRKFNTDISVLGFYPKLLFVLLTLKRTHSLKIETILFDLSYYIFLS